ncbi:hypothetical protein Pelo_18528 [Pelomyxa schiedti]|nr:hypothetical protein Pelo_18528 [Pelomyxa schiedti]
MSAPASWAGEGAASWVSVSVVVVIYYYMAEPLAEAHLRDPAKRGRESEFQSLQTGRDMAQSKTESLSLVAWRLCNIRAD